MPEEYRNKIAKVREYGLGLEKKKIKSLQIGEAGFEVGIGDIEKFDEAEKVLESVVEKEKVNSKNNR